MLHQLRHTHATKLVKEGVNLNTIRKRLGHTNMHTTCAILTRAMRPLMQTCGRGGDEKMSVG